MIKEEQDACMYVSKSSAMTTIATRMYVCMHVCMYVCMHVCMYVSVVPL